MEEAVRIALKRVVGAYVILLMDAADPETIIAARKGSPLVIGIGKGEHFLGSDASPMLEYTKEVVYVNDYELAISYFTNSSGTIAKISVDNNKSISAILQPVSGYYPQKKEWYQFNCERRKIPGKQAVVVMACDNQHIGEEMILEPGLVMIFAHGIE